MKPSRLFHDTDVKPFRFALVFAAIVVAILLSKSTDAQEASAPQINWMTSYQEALNQASESNAPIMLYFGGSDWCPWTQKLSEEVFATSEFVAWADTKFIPVMLDFPKKTSLPTEQTNQNNLLLDRFRPHLTGFPTALFVDPSGNVIGKMGYEKEGVLVWIHKAQKIVGKLDKVASNYLPMRFLAIRR